MACARKNEDTPRIIHAAIVATAGRRVIRSLLTKDRSTLIPIQSDDGVSWEDSSALPAPSLKNHGKASSNKPLGDGW